MTDGTLDKDTIAKLEAEHGELVIVSTAMGDCAFRCAKPAEFDRYTALIFSEKTRPKAAEMIVRACRVYPSAAEFDNYLAKKPGIVTTCAGHVLEHSGVESEPDVKKSAQKSEVI